MTTTPSNNTMKKCCQYYCPHCGYPIRGRPDEERCDIEDLRKLIVKWFGRKCQRCKKYLNFCIKQ